MHPYKDRTSKRMHSDALVKQIQICVPDRCDPDKPFSHLHVFRKDSRLCVTGVSLQQVLSSGPNPHLFDDLLVQNGSLLLQLTPSRLRQRVASLQREEIKTQFL